MKPSKKSSAAPSHASSPSPFALPAYTPTTLEPAVLTFWAKHKTYAKLKKKLAGKKHAPFYFLDGPPYTSGKVHLGTAWNKCLKDAVQAHAGLQRVGSGRL